MCAPGTIEAVRQRLAEDNRRNFLKTVAMTGAAAAGIGGSGCQTSGGSATGIGVDEKERPNSGETSTRQRNPVTFSRVVDLTHVLHDGFPAWFEEKEILGRKTKDGKDIVAPPIVEVEEVVTFANEKLNLKKVAFWEHVGTHMDAPNHFSDGITADEIPAEDLVLPLVVVDIREKAASDPLALVTLEDLQKWETEHGRLPEKCCVAMNSGWGKKVDTPNFKSLDENGKIRQPAFHVDAANFMIEQRNVKGMAVDTLSLDNQHAHNHDVHYRWLGSGRWGVENVNNLDQIPPKGSTIEVGQPRIKGTTGGPNRIMALL